MNTIESTLTRLPHLPGVYLYRNNEHTVIYVGKARDLSRRVKSYFSRDDAVGAKTATLVSQIASIQTIQTASEFDALLLEAKLIKQYMPKYNVIAKDDKSPLYVYITLSEELPHITFVRKHDMEMGIKSKRKDRVFGPFQSSRVLRMLLRNLRRAIPYCTQSRRTGIGCFYTHIGLCKPCPSVIAKMPPGREQQALTRAYRKHIYRLARILSGQSTAVLRDMEKEMKQYAAEDKFELAADMKRQIDAIYSLLSYKYDPTLYLEKVTAAGDMRSEEEASLLTALQPYFPHLTQLSRIECVDLSHLGGTDATGSLVVLTHGVVDTSQYRRFRIRGAEATDDTARMYQVLMRRFTHEEWPSPDLLVVDGGKAQVATAHAALNQLQKEIPIIGLAKRQEEIIVKAGSEFNIIRLPFSSPGLQLIQRIRDEAHRFAKSYQIKLRGKVFKLS